MEALVSKTTILRKGKTALPKHEKKYLGVFFSFFFFFCFFNLINNFFFQLTSTGFTKIYQDTQKSVANMKNPKIQIFFPLGQYWEVLDWNCFLRRSPEGPGSCWPGCQHVGMLLAKMTETYPKRVWENALNTLFICNCGCPHRAVVN